MAERSNRLIAVVKALRVYQWTKNLLVLAALIFAEQLMIPGQVELAVLAFAAFCMASSATYLFNDLMDIEKDRSHPKKRHRPIASGALPIPAAWIMLVILLAGSIALGAYIRTEFLLPLLGYMALTISYSLFLKNWIIIDVMAVAIGFVLRAMAGAIALDVTFTNWLIVCTLFLALFLGLSKRRHEIVLLEEGAGSHRAVLYHYSTQYLDSLILIVASGAIITYTIYTCSPEVIERLNTDKLYLTLPFVVYGLFRYLFLIHHKTGGGDPSSTLLKDWPLGLTVVLWGITCVLLIYV
jgi:4-hydroxybenzoate polyprenyltransferase